MDNYVGGLSPSIRTKERLVEEEQIDNAVSQISQNMADNPLEEGEQFNLAGYSYGSVVQAHAALRLANKGQKIDNLILIGSPISDKSPLYKQLKNNKNIGNVIRIDIEGDKLSNPQDIWDYMQGGAETAWQGDNAPHFDLARPGEDVNKRIREVVVQWLLQQGVK